MTRNGLVARFGELRVTTRISIGFGVALSLVLVLAVVGLIALYGISRSVGSFSATADVARTAADADIILRDLEVAVRDVLAYGDDDSLAEAGRRRDALAERLTSLAATVPSGQDHAAAGEAAKALDAFWSAFQNVIARRGERVRLVATVLDPLVEQIRTRFDKLKDAGGIDSASLAADAAISVLQMRDSLGRYTERHDPRDAERSRAALEAARGRLSELTRYLWVQGTRQLINELDSMLGAVAGVLDRLQDVVEEEDRLRADSMEASAAAVAARTGEIRQRNDAAAAALRKGLSDRAWGTVKAALWVGGVLLAFGALATWLVARSVTRPIRAMAAAVAALAAERAGPAMLPAAADPAVEDHGDEIARMARAVEILRAHAEEMERQKAEARATQARLLDEKDRAEAQNRAKTDFLVGMGQELHGPLGAIVDASQSLMTELHRLGAGELLNEAESIQWSGEQLVGLIDAILDYARIEAGGVDVCVQDFDVARLLAEVRERSYAAADLNGDTLEVKAGPDLGGMHSDFGKVRQALLNLMDNACKFTVDGAVTLSAERVQRDGRSWLRFTVADTGPGFPAGKVGHLFQPFVQGAGTHGNAKPKGAGLGLTLVGHYVAMLGGDIEVDSTPGAGTRITLALPAVYEAPAEDRPLVSETTTGSPRPLLTLADYRALPQAL